MGKWAELSSTARLSQPVTKSEQAPALHPLAKMSLEYRVQSTVYRVQCTEYSVLLQTNYAEVTPLYNAFSYNFDCHLY